MLHLVYILRNNLIRPRPSRLVSCFLHGASCHLISLSVRSFAVTSILAFRSSFFSLLASYYVSSRRKTSHSSTCAACRVRLRFAFPRKTAKQRYEWHSIARPISIARGSHNATCWDHSSGFFYFRARQFPLLTFAEPADWKATAGASPPWARSSIKSSGIGFIQPGRQQTSKHSFFGDRSWRS